MKKTLAAAAVILTLCAPAAQALTFIGVIDCGTWINRPQSFHKSWLVGYLSGLSSGSSDGTTDVLKKLSSGDQAIVWVNNYCQKNPLKSVSDAANELFIELERKQ